MNNKEFFKLYKSFLVKCDLLEEGSGWDTDKLGKMYVYYEEDMIAAIFSLIISDGQIHENELDFLNDAFGFNYTLDELREAYEKRLPIINDVIDEFLQEDIEVLEEIDSGTADEYKKLLVMAFDKVIESDGVVTQGEKDKASELVKMLSWKL